MAHALSRLFEQIDVLDGSCIIFCAIVCANMFVGGNATKENAQQMHKKLHTTFPKKSMSLALFRHARTTLDSVQAQEASSRNALEMFLGHVRIR